MQLLVRSAMGMRLDNDAHATALVNAGMDVIVVNSSQDNSKDQLKMVAHLKKTHPQLQVISGNVVVPSQALNLIQA